MIRKLLVANRGEIARRIFRTCDTMGIATVAVYSDPDRTAPFVGEAREAIALGGASPSETYLRIDAIVEAADRTGADAVHPGYGFLAENADFARAVIDAGLIWVGPPPTAIETMGSKLESKRIMVDAGVPTLAAVDLTGISEGGAASSAEEVGYPILVKASAGGGGKGMRIVRDPAELGEAIAGAHREAGSAFGDDTVFIERYIEAPRHIEIQVFADTHGNIVSLFERECSIQRRHQKIIEETPSPAIDDDLRKRMGEAAVAAATAVGYVGAGTVEFLFHDNEFSFLEMNTRLQVEHPVTEEVTGLDLVRLQLLVASGEPLPEEALEPVLFGHAIEARLYAEDPANGYLPVTGRLDRFWFDLGTGARLDSGVETGSEISIHYDPMIAKVIAWADTRQEAAAVLASTLARAHLHGPATNRELLVRILRHPEFIAGDTDTHFLERHDPVAMSSPLPDAHEQDVAALAVAFASQEEHRATTSVQATIPSGWRNSASQLQQTTFALGDREVTVGYRFVPRDGLVAEIDGAPLGSVELVACSPDRVGLITGGHLRWFDVHRAGTTIYVDGPSGPVTMEELSRFPAAELDDDPGSLHAPMPGKVIRVLVEEGDQIKDGQVLVVLEAMKMEHSLRAPHAGTVASVRAAESEQVEADQILVVIEE